MKLTITYYTATKDLIIMLTIFLSLKQLYSIEEDLLWAIDKHFCLISNVSVRS